MVVFYPKMPLEKRGSRGGKLAARSDMVKTRTNDG
jgi:hypothetical protein